MVFERDDPLFAAAERACRPRGDVVEVTNRVFEVHFHSGIQAKNKRCNVNYEAAMTLKAKPSTKTPFPAR
ncbi:hypothetical protein D3C76_1771780 [compost metagenome]